MEFFSTFSMIRKGSKRKKRPFHILGGGVGVNNVGEIPHIFFKMTSSHSHNPFFKFRSMKR